MKEQLIQISIAVIPVVVGGLAPMITAGIKKLVGMAGARIPNTLVPVFNALIGAVVGGLTGGDPTQGVIGAQVGKSVRDQINKSNEEAKTA